MVQYSMIFHASLQCLRCYLNQSVYSQKTPNTSAIGCLLYTILRILEKIDCVTMALHCIMHWTHKSHLHVSVMVYLCNVYCKYIYLEKNVPCFNSLRLNDTYICISKFTIIGSDNGLLPGQHHTIIWTNTGILLIGPLGTNCNEIYTF